MVPVKTHLKFATWHENGAHLFRMKNITLSAQDALIKQARLVAQSRCTTLNAAFREWLKHYAAESGSGADVQALMSCLRHVKSSGPYSRDELNER